MLFTTAIRTALAAGTVVTLSSVAGAQEAESRPSALEIRVPSGSFNAIGAQGNQLRDAHLTALQLSWVVRPHLAVTATVGWARSRDLLSAGSPKVDVFTSDLGLEARSREWNAGRNFSLSTFAGFGAGARSYNYVKLDEGARHNLAGYASAGGELGAGRVALRIEARNYTTGFKPLAGAGTADTRNDMVVVAAVRINRRTSGNR